MTPSGEKKEVFILKWGRKRHLIEYRCEHCGKICIGKKGRKNQYCINCYKKRNIGITHKICNKCRRKLPLTAFHKRCDRPIGVIPSCKKCRKKYWKRNALYIKKQRKAVNKLTPWLPYYRYIYARCSFKPRRYFKRGIKNLITKEEVKYLWFRDKAWLLKKPSIDRIDPYGNYTLANCRFIELSENCRRKRAKYDR